MPWGGEPRADHIIQGQFAVSVYSTRTGDVTAPTNLPWKMLRKMTLNRIVSIKARARVSYAGTISLRANGIRDCGKRLGSTLLDKRRRKARYGPEKSNYDQE